MGLVLLMVAGVVLLGAVGEPEIMRKRDDEDGAATGGSGSAVDRGGEKR